MSLCKQIPKLTTALLVAVSALPSTAAQGEGQPAIVVPDGDLEAVGMTQETAQYGPDLPAIVLPDGDIAEPAEPSGVAPGEVVLAMLREELTQRYLKTGAEGLDLDRLGALLSGEYISDYEYGDHEPVQFRNGVFVPLEEGADTDPEVPREGPVPPADQAIGGFILTPQSLQAMSGMTRDQIEAIALMMRLSQDPGGALLSPQSTLNSIPSLSDDSLGNTSTDALVSALANRPHASEPRVVDVGNGKDLALLDWEVIVNPDGRVELSNPKLPGSRFAVEEGMIVGRFGRVTDVSVQPGDVHVSFETGDRIDGQTISLDRGIPAMGTAVAEGSQFEGEILVSGGVPRSRGEGEAPETSGQPDPENAQADATGRIGTSGEFAPVISPRPQLNPSRL